MRGRIFRHAAPSSRVAVPIYIVFCWTLLLFQAAAQDDSFIYHGNLDDQGSPANGNFDIRYRLFNQVTAGDQIGIDATHIGVPIVDGSFSSEVDFGDGAFSGGEVWMELAVRPAGIGNYVPLSPRQKIHSLPAASFSKAAADVTGVLAKERLPGDTIYGVNGIVGPAMLPPDLVYTGDEGIVGPAMLPPDLVYTGDDGIVGPMFLPKELIYGVDGIVGPAMLPPDLVYQGSNGGISVLGASDGLSSAVLNVESSGNMGVALHAHHESSNSTAVLVNEGTGDLVRGLSGADGSTLVFQVENNGRVTAESFAPTSDRNAKENFTKLDPQEILQKLAAIPVTRWNFKSDSETTHIGPMAQDFFATFGVGRDDKHIATVDADGIALAAIQGLNQKLSDREREVAQLQAENRTMGARIDALEAMLRTIVQELEKN